MTNHFRSALKTTYIPLRCFSRSAITAIANLLILEFISDTSYSSTCGIFRSHCLCSLWQTIETTRRIEVSGLDTLTCSSTILMSHIARYTENNCSLLRSKIRELHPFHKASLQAVLRHLFRVASHSDKNAMTLEALATRFWYIILRGNAVLEGGVDAKARF